MKVEQLSFSAERAPISIEHEHSKITHIYVLYVHTVERWWWWWYQVVGGTMMEKQIRQNEHDPTLRSSRMLTDKIFLFRRNILIFSYLFVLFPLHSMNLAYTMKCKKKFRNFMYYTWPYILIAISLSNY